MEEEVVEDIQAFEAALSFVDEFSFAEAAVEGLPTALLDNAPMEMQDDSASASTPSVSIGPTARRNAPAKRLPSSEEKRKRQRETNERRKLLRKAGVYGNSNRVRNERTREVAVLREQLEKLQLDVKALQRQQTEQQWRAKRAEVTALIAENAASVPSIWRDQAVRQRRRRGEAERDNVRLRLAVERQKKVASSLQGLMQKRASQLVRNLGAGANCQAKFNTNASIVLCKTNECASLVSTCCPKRNAVDVLDFCGDIGDFRDLFRRLDSAYRDIDSVFAANGLAALSISPTDVHVREGVDGKFLEFSTYKDLPFDLQDTTEAAWNHFKGVEKHMGNGSLYQKAAKNLDEPYTIVEDFSKEVYSNSSRADVKVKQVVRRYLEPDRDIVIWVSHCTPAQVKHKLLRGLVYSFLGYCVTRRSPGNELTQLQLCSLICLDQETEYGADSIHALTNFLVVHAAKNILTHREHIENALADRALRRIEA
ncbi:hypothetical protein PHYPSEUDO_005555 [Phytophthora pseudosyringae]|uniref:Uncharacterized protein n=1 Tax=Phytophthora pseudosyringae TaxID=221518 RepID=A0A8T1WFW4_9STRA|nr:hypothetical protein PHYPSEUDO_005555 [Phytophthora pseudosyringae]